MLNIVLGLLFSGVGLVALKYGKKEGKAKPMMLGGALLVYPYFTPDALLTGLIGAGLTTLLFVWKD
ncbi:hypothetical protein EPO15_09990 [bacterium]|nr:MAG: hypothetical protein EPO15_09990 [bacterium]